MCGFVGFVNTSDSYEVSFSQVKKIIKAVEHRGPDDESFWTSENQSIYFGFKRLSIVDLSTNGRQPMVSKNKNFVLMINGEVYNYQELKKKLNISDEQLVGQSDTEILLHSIEKYGLEKSLEFVEGMFALCLYDLVNNKIFLARDRFGEKPIYYGNINNTFLFSSQISAFKLYKDYKPDLDYDSISLYFRYNYIPSPKSIYKNIFKLDPGNILEYDLKQNIKFKIKPWFSLSNLYLDNYNQFKGTFNDSIKLFSEKISNSVSYHKNLDVKTGIYLSGGLDSSILAASIAKDYEISTHNIRFESKDYDESSNARALSEYIGSNHYEYFIKSKDIQNIIENISSIYDEPFADSSQIPTSLISAYSKDKIKVALTGDGGDEFFMGYNRYIWAVKIYKRINQIPSYLRKVIFMFLSSPLSKQFINFLNLYFLPNNLKLNHTINKLEKILNIISNKDDFKNIYEGFLLNWNEDIIDKNNNLFDHIITNKDLHLWNIGFSNEEKMMLVDTKNYLCDDIFTKVDRATMFYGIEARAPFLNLDLIKFAYSLPIDFKLKNNQGKYLMREYLNEIDIPNFNNFSKKGFHMPIKEWIREDLREYFIENFNSKNIKENNILDYNLISKTLLEHLNFNQNNEYKIWSIFIFFQWYANQ